MAALALDGGEALGVAHVPLPAAEGLGAADRTGVHIWPVTAVLLAAAVEGHFEVQGKNALELGAGCHGVAGRALHCWWPSVRLTLTDGIEEAVDTLRGVAASDVTVLELDWTDPEATVCLDAPVDLVFGSDIVYDPCLVQPLAEQLGLLVHAACEAWLAVEERDPETIADFQRCVEREQLRCERVACSDAVWERALAWLAGVDTSHHQEGQGIAARDKVFLLHITKLARP